MGTADVRPLHRHLRRRSLQRRRVPPRDRADESRALSRIALLRALALCLRDAARREGRALAPGARGAQGEDREGGILMPVLKAEMAETLAKTGASCRVDLPVAPRF